MSEHLVVTTLFPGDLVFDIGANTGDKAAAFQERGARVVCVEPQPSMIEALRKRFSDKAQVEVVGKAVGAASGELPMNICSKSPTLSTFSENWKTGRFSGYHWDSVVRVPVTTLDELVEAYGVPRYLKIDVEGYEQQVLSGLSRRVGIVSFEFTSEFVSDAYDCVRLLIRLGYTQFNLTIGEETTFALPQWVPFSDLLLVLSSNSRLYPLLWGDIYAN